MAKTGGSVANEGTPKKLQAQIPHSLSHSSSDQQLRCYLCDVTLLTESELDTHLNIHVKQEISLEMLHQEDDTCAAIKCEPAINIKEESSDTLIPETLSLPSETKSTEYKVADNQAAVSRKARVQSYTCDVCNKTFCKKYLLKRHLRIHTGEKPFQCEICGKRFRLALCLRRHKPNHTQEPPCLCKICGKSFIHSFRLRSHTLMYHANRKTLKCNFCNSSCLSPSMLRQHMAKVHTDLSLECDQCDKVFKTRPGLANHVRRMHTAGKSLQCNICGQTCAYRESLRAHKLQHETRTDAESCKCHVCDKLFACKSSLTAHNRRFHNGAEKTVKPANVGNIRYKCKTCGKVYTQAATFKHHMNLHLGVSFKQFQCEICPKFYTRAAHLREHVNRMHLHLDKGLTQLKPHMCDVCGKAFLRLHDLKIHSSAVHNNERQFPCSVCGKRFARKYYVKTHMRLHDSGKPFGCEVCFKRYNSSLTLSGHLHRSHGIEQQPE